MPKRQDRFVVGYRGQAQCVYGENAADGTSAWIEPMSLSRAREMAAEEMLGPPVAVVYELREYRPLQRRAGSRTR